MTITSPDETFPLTDEHVAALRIQRRGEFEVERHAHGRLRSIGVVGWRVAGATCRETVLAALRCTLKERHARWSAQDLADLSSEYDSTLKRAGGGRLAWVD